MPRYLVAHRYFSNLGTFAEGTEVEVDEHLAAWINRDSPGTLVLAPKKERALEAPPQDRQHRGSRKRGA